MLKQAFLIKSSWLVFFDNIQITSLLKEINNQDNDNLIPILYL